MYRGFNLDIESTDLSSFLGVGESIHKANKSSVRKALDELQDDAGNLLASKIVADWFPPYEADVFLSHSHKDEDEVIALAGWLKVKFGLTSFIDSCIWGYSEELLKMIDDKYCYSSSAEIYDYKKRNRSTSHVYMMLSTALTRMINGCECVIFVNTPNSISAKDYINGETTESPWIYSEIAMTSLIQKRMPAEHRKLLIKSEASVEDFRDNFVVKYEVDLRHLTSLDDDDLKNWEYRNYKSGAESLDTLYKIKE